MQVEKYSIIYFGTEIFGGRLDSGTEIFRNGPLIKQYLMICIRKGNIGQWSLVKC